MLPALGLLWVRALALGIGFAAGLMRFRATIRRIAPDQRPAARGQTPAGSQPGDADPAGHFPGDGRCGPRH